MQESAGGQEEDPTMASGIDPEDQAEEDNQDAVGAESSRVPLDVEITGVNASSYPYVTFYVRITEKEGASVQGLSASDFECKELCAAGEFPVSVTLFKYVSKSGASGDEDVYEIAYVSSQAGAADEYVTVSMSLVQASHYSGNGARGYKVPQSSSSSQDSGRASKSGSTQDAGSPSSSQQSGGQYVISDSNVHQYTKEELVDLGLDDYELYLARNEIYARHGLIFDNVDLDHYFRSKSWYRPLYAHSEFDPYVGSILSAIEQANVSTINALEKQVGSPYAV